MFLFGDVRYEFSVDLLKQNRAHRMKAPCILKIIRSVIAVPKLQWAKQRCQVEDVSSPGHMRMPLGLYDFALCACTLTSKAASCINQLPMMTLLSCKVLQIWGIFFLEFIWLHDSCLWKRARNLHPKRFTVVGNELPQEAPTNPVKSKQFTPQWTTLDHIYGVHWLHLTALISLIYSFRCAYRMLLMYDLHQTSRWCGRQALLFLPEPNSPRWNNDLLQVGKNRKD